MEIKPKSAPCKAKCPTYYILFGMHFLTIGSVSNRNKQLSRSPAKKYSLTILWHTKTFTLKENYDILVSNNQTLFSYTVCLSCTKQEPVSKSPQFGVKLCIFSKQHVKNNSIIPCYFCTVLRSMPSLLPHILIFGIEGWLILMILKLSSYSFLNQCYYFTVNSIKLLNTLAHCVSKWATLPPLKWKWWRGSLVQAQVHFYLFT